MKMDEIDKLTTPNGSPCVSMIIRTEASNKKKNYELLKKSIQEAKALLKSKFPQGNIPNELALKLERVIADIPKTFSNGLGVFVSPTHYSIMTFPFEVKSRVILNETFDIRDVLYLRQYSSPYYVLNLNKKGVHLFRGVLNDLEEVKDAHFPLPFEDQYEYERATIADSSSSSLKSFEKDKHEISEIRLKAVFRDADGFIGPHLASGARLLLAGTQRMIGLYYGITNHKKEIAGKISGSFNENNFRKLSESAWQTFMRFKKNEIVALIKELDERKNEHVAEGLQDVWATANEGRGLMLFVERDLHHRGYQKEDSFQLHLQPPKKPYTVLPDAVEDLIKTVETKNGKVLYTENGQLKRHDHLALVLRY